jgi:hypothetical protein
MLDFVVGAIIPVCDWEYAEILIVVKRCRTVDLDYAYDTIGVLRGKLRMVPEVLSGSA